MKKKYNFFKDMKIRNENKLIKYIRDFKLYYFGIDCWKIYQDNCKENILVN